MYIGPRGLLGWLAFERVSMDMDYFSRSRDGPEKQSRLLGSVAVRHAMCSFRVRMLICIPTLIVSGYFSLPTLCSNLKLRIYQNHRCIELGAINHLRHCYWYSVVSHAINSLCQMKSNAYSEVFRLSWSPFEFRTKIICPDRNPWNHKSLLMLDSVSSSAL